MMMQVVKRNLVMRMKPTKYESKCIAFSLFLLSSLTEIFCFSRVMSKVVKKKKLTMIPIIRRHPKMKTVTKVMYSFLPVKKNTCFAVYRFLTSYYFFLLERGSFTVAEGRKEK